MSWRSGWWDESIPPEEKSIWGIVIIIAFFLPRGNRKPLENYGFLKNGGVWGVNDGSAVLYTSQKPSLRLPQLAQQASYPASHVRLAYLMLQPQFLRHQAETGQVAGHQGTHTQPFD
jgi:hypothetical protein